MQFKNPIDIELVDAAQEAYDILVRINEFMGVSPDSVSGTLRLKNALNIAKTQMRAEEELSQSDFTNTTLAPTSMD